MKNLPVDNGNQRLCHPPDNFCAPFPPWRAFGRWCLFALVGAERPAWGDLSGSQPDRDGQLVIGQSGDHPERGESCGELQQSLDKGVDRHIREVFRGAGQLFVGVVEAID